MKELKEMKQEARMNELKMEGNQEYEHKINGVMENERRGEG